MRSDQVCPFSGMREPLPPTMGNKQDEPQSYTKRTVWSSVWVLSAQLREALKRPHGQTTFRTQVPYHSLQWLTGCDLKGPSIRLTFISISTIQNKMVSMICSINLLPGEQRNKKVWLIIHKFESNHLVKHDQNVSFQQIQYKGLNSGVSLKSIIYNHNVDQRKVYIDKLIRHWSTGISLFCPGSFLATQ